MTQREIELGEYRAALKVLDAQRQILKSVDADKGVILALEAILRHLHRLPSGQLDKLRGVLATKSPLVAEKKAFERRAGELPLEEVQSLLDDEASSREKLEAIAIGRFQVPRGSMRSMGNIEQLRETLRMYVRNEQAHESISQVAQRHR
jgi:hypothetical protein